jgi:hypothetical protein
VVAERFAGMHVGQVHLDERQADAEQGIAQGCRGVGEGAGVDDDEAGAVGARGVDAVDQHVLGIGLQAVQHVAGGAGLVDQSASISASVARP